MATKFLLQLNNLNFQVNPTGLNITKAVSYSTLATQGGVQYQVWYDSPEVLVITGMSAGNTAYQELVFLRQQYELTNKLSQLFYKTRLYFGFITNMSIEHSITHINTFTYSISFQLLQGQQFAVEDFSLTGNEQGALSGTINRIAGFINQPLSQLNSSVGQLLGKVNQV